MAVPSDFTFSIEDIAKILDVHLEKDIKQFIENLATDIKTIQLQGRTDEEIIKAVFDGYKKQTGIWNSLKGTLGGRIDFSLNASSELAANQTIVKESKALKFKWVWEPVAEHCETCIDRNDQVKTYQEWEAIGLPAQSFESGNYGTVCGYYCKCILIPVIGE